MTKNEILITPKLFRALVLLLLLLPMVPSALLVRFAWETFETERAGARSTMMAMLRRQFALASRRLEDTPEVAGLERVPQEEWKTEIEHYFEKVLGVKKAVTVYRVGKDKPDGSGQGKMAVVRQFRGGVNGWAAGLRVDAVDILLEEGEHHIRKLKYTGGLILGGVVLTALLAGFLVHRQLRIEEMKSDFLATVSHELKTPVASMRLLIDTLKDSDDIDPVMLSDYLDLISGENIRLQKTLENFLTYWRLEQRREDFFMDWVSPEVLANGAADSVRPKAEAEGGRLTVKVKRPILSDLRADREAINTVLVALLDNAVKYSPESPEVVMDVFQSGESMFFQIGDNGVGIPKDHQQKIFDRFYRVDQRLSRKGGGCGLGLSIARFIVEAHNGNIGVLNRKGEPGCIFWVRIPLASPLLVK